MADKQASPEQFSVDMYFEIQSQADMTKHKGAFKVTDELLRETKVTEKTYLQDIGYSVYIGRKPKDRP